MSSFGTSLKSLVSSAVLATVAFASSATAGIPQLDEPRITCVGSTPTTISLMVQAGESGAPFGFLVQWLPADDDGACPTWPRVNKTCFATFEPQSASSNYALGPYWAVTVTIGNLDPLDPEVTTNCPDLTCGTTYCFRIKALGGNDGVFRAERSPFAESSQCSTDPCGEFGQDYCSYSQGGFGAPPNGNNPATLLLDAAFPWPVTMCELAFPDQPSVEAYLPHGGKPGPISDEANGGSLAGQVLTAKLNMVVSDLHLSADACCTQLGTQGLALRDLTLCFDDGPLAALNGATVGQAVEAAEAALCSGELPASVASFSDLASIIEQINLNFHGETACTDNGHLCVPGN